MRSGCSRSSARSAALAYDRSAGDGKYTGEVRPQLPSIEATWIVIPIRSPARRRLALRSRQSAGGAIVVEVRVHVDQHARESEPGMPVPPHAEPRAARRGAAWRGPRVLVSWGRRFPSVPSRQTAMPTPPPTPPRPPGGPARGAGPPSRPAGAKPAAQPRPARPPRPPRLPRRWPAWLARAGRLLVSPAGEWLAIAGEFTTAGPIYTGYLVPMAAIGPLAATLGTALFGERSSLATLGDTYPMSLGDAVTSGVLEYGLNLAAVSALAAVIE